MLCGSKHLTQFRRLKFKAYLVNNQTRLSLLVLLRNDLLELAEQSDIL